MTIDLAPVVVPGALLTTALGLAAAAIAWAATRRWRLALQVLLEFLTAAGLLRLVVATGWQAIASAALIIVIRHTVSFGLRAPDARRATARSASRPASGAGSTGFPGSNGRVGRAGVLLRRELGLALRPLRW